MTKKSEKKEEIVEKLLEKKVLAEEKKVDANDAIIVSNTGYCQWAVGQDGTYMPTFTSIKTIPPGVYEIKKTNQGQFFLQKQRNVLSDNILELPMKEMGEILKDIDDFWNRKDLFKKYKIVYKRGILMWGGQGTGKSYLIQNIINNVIKRDGIAFSLNDEASTEMFIEFSQVFRTIEPDRPLVVMIEDIDNIVTQGHGLLSALLNVLDGVNQIENVVYLATTNYPERLQERISNRPSRFDRVYEIPVPTPEVRKFYLLHKLHETDVDKVDVEKWVKETEGLSLSHIKELIVSVLILGKNFDDIIKHFAEMKRPKNSRSGSGGSKLGF